MTPSPQRIADFLGTFFGDSNRIKLTDTVSGARMEKVRPWIARLEEPAPRPTVLPRWQGDQVEWYAIAFSDRERACLAEELLAFVGPSYSTFRGERAYAREGDPVDAAVAELVGDGAFFRFTPGPGKAGATKVHEALERLRTSWAQGRIRAPERVRATGRVLRDFFMALAVPDREAAEDALHYLRDHHRLDALNLLFLRVRLLSALGAWADILGLAELPDLLKVRRPAAVTEGIVQGTYEQELAPFEQSDSPSAAVRHFNLNILPRLGGIFSWNGRTRTAQILKCAAIQAIGFASPESARPADPAVLAAILAISDLAAEDRAYIEKVAKLLPAAANRPVPTPTVPLVADPMEAAETALDLGDMAGAFTLAKGAVPSRRSVRVLFAAAFELGLLDAELAALHAFKELSSQDQQTLLRLRLVREVHERLAKPTADPVDSPLNGWSAWLERVNSDEAWATKHAVSVARSGADEWPVALLADGAHSEFLALLESSRPTSADGVFHESLPFVLQAFKKDPEWPRKSFAPIYSTLIDILVVSTEGADADLAVLSDLVRGLLVVGVDAKRYAECVDYANEVWKSFASPAKTDWGLEFIDLLIEQPCRSPDLRFSLVHAVAQKALSFGRRFTPDQKRLLRLLVLDLKQEAAFPQLFIEDREPDGEELARDEFLRLANKKMAVYTLRVSAARRFRDIVLQACDSVSISLFHDLVANASLLSAAKTADIFVLVTGEAAHAATIPLVAARPKNLPMIRPAGCGTMSMIRELRTFLRGAG